MTAPAECKDTANMVATPAPQHDHDFTEQASFKPRRAFRNYMVYQDGRPFLIVNSEPVHVRNLVSRFAANDPGCDWTYAPLTC